MGILRLILAISVVVMHCDPDLSKWVLVGGQFAVKLFFIVSGFYMAMVLTEKYHGPGSVRLFYGNRLLRLLPTYYLVIAIALLVPWLAGIILHRPVSIGQLAVWKLHGDQLPDGIGALLIALQATPVGQELGFMTGLDISDRSVHASVADGPLLGLFNFLMIPPAWSISLELQFYALAPWLVGRRLVLLATIAASAAALYFILPNIPGYSLDYLCHFTLLTEIAFFILGIFAYRVLCWIRTLPPESRWVRATPLFHGAAILTILAYPWLGSSWRNGAVALTFAALVPWCFLNTSRTRWDRAIGELSYPFYLAHWFVMRACYALIGPQRLETLPGFATAALVTLVGLALAALIHHGLERPIDRYRQARLRRVTA